MQPCCPERLLSPEKITEYLKALEPLLDLLIPIFAVEDARLLPGTFPQWEAHAFLGIPKGAALVFPSQKPEPGIETGYLKKSPRLQLSVVCPRSTNKQS